MEVHPLRIVADVDGEFFEFITVSQASELLGLSQYKVKSLMIGRKSIQGKLRYITVPELTAKQPHGNLRILLDKNFKDVAVELAKRRLQPKKLPTIRKHDREY